MDRGSALSQPPPLLTTLARTRLRPQPVPVNAEISTVMQTDEPECIRPMSELRTTEAHARRLDRGSHGSALCQSAQSSRSGSVSGSVSSISQTSTQSRISPHHSSSWSSPQTGTGASCSRTEATRVPVSRV